METRASYVTVGAFVMICLLGLIATSMWFAEGGGGGPKLFFKTSFEGPVTGLGEGTIVRFNGIEVGNVTELAIQPDQPQNVLVTLLVKSDTVVREDSKASIEMAGLTGPSYVEISGGSTGAKKLDGKASATDAPVIPAIKSKMQDLLEGTQQLVQDFRAVTNQVKELLSADNQKSVHDMLAHLSSTTAVLDEHSNDLGNILKNFDTASGKILTTLGKTDDTLDSARTVMTSANHAIGTLEDTLAAGKTTVVRVGQLSDHIDKAVTGLDVTQINRLMAEARVMVANITRLSTGLEREPGKIIYGDSRQGYSPR